jgi:hypothetical protein
MSLFFVDCPVLEEFQDQHLQEMLSGGGLSVPHCVLHAIVGYSELRPLVTPLLTLDPPLEERIREVLGQHLCFALEAVYGPRNKLPTFNLSQLPRKRDFI